MFSPILRVMISVLVRIVPKLLFNVDHFYHIVLGLFHHARRMWDDLFLWFIYSNFLSAFSNRIGLTHQCWLTNMSLPSWIYDKIWKIWKLTFKIISDFVIVEACYVPINLSVIIDVKFQRLWRITLSNNPFSQPCKHSINYLWMVCEQHNGQEFIRILLNQFSEPNFYFANVSPQQIQNHQCRNSGYRNGNETSGV